MSFRDTEVDRRQGSSADAIDAQSRENMIDGMPDGDYSFGMFSVCDAIGQVVVAFDLGSAVAFRLGSLVLHIPSKCLRRGLPGA